MKVLRHLSALIAPPRCALCGAPCGCEAALCAACERWLARSRRPAAPGATPALEAVFAATPYEGLAREMVAALKFRAALPLAGRMAEAIAATSPPGLLGGSLVPVPAAPRRLRRRGFDPAAEIARRLGALAGLPVASCLVRLDGPRQVGRRRSERLGSPPRVFARGPAPLRAVLVDDVLTTGATLAACAAALRGAGAASVAAVAFARTP